MDQRVNDLKVLVKNIYERVVLQSIRISIFLRQSPKWKSKQNIKFILKFTLNISKRIYNLGKKWNQLELIRFDLSYSDVKLIAVNAVLSQWTFGKISDRINERNALKILKHFIENNRNQTNLKIINCLDFIPKNTLLKPFNQIIFK